MLLQAADLQNRSALRLLEPTVKVEKNKDKK
jgi:hypothetical protein